MGYGKYRAPVLGSGAQNAGLLPGAISGGGVRSFTEIYDLSDSAVDRAIGENNVVATIPQGHALQSIKVRSTVSLSTSQLSFGTSEDADLFGVAAAYGTTPEVEKEYLLAAQKGVPLEAAETELLMTNGTAALPATGVVIVEVETSARG